MERVVITIARQYGSGGRTVGKMLAKKLGIPCYGSNLVDLLLCQNIHRYLFIRCHNVASLTFSHLRGIIFSVTSRSVKGRLFFLPASFAAGGEV